MSLYQGLSPLAEVGRLKGETNLGTVDKTINSDEALYIASGEEASFNNLTIDGIIRNDGILIVKETLTINRTLTNNGEVEIGAW